METLKLIPLLLLMLTACQLASSPAPGSLAADSISSAQPTVTAPPVGFSLEIQAKKLVISVQNLPGDGGGCMADYLGYDAPSFVLYEDGQLLLHIPDESAWYSQSQLSPQQMEVLLDQIEGTGFFTIAGDGRLFEDDPIYTLPENLDQGLGASTIFFSVYKDGLSKQVSIYDPWLDYVTLEVASALQIIRSYRPDGMVTYHPENWVAWVENTDPCEPYQLEYLPWPEGLLDMAALIDNAPRGQLVFKNTAKREFTQLLGDKPGTYTYQVDGVSYYILARPLLPHELPSDFLDY